MEVVYVVLAMIVVGIVIGLLAGIIWKNNKPIGTGGDILVSVVTAVVIGLLDIIVIPAMGLALFVLWLVRRVKRVEPTLEAESESVVKQEAGEDTIICSYCGDPISSEVLSAQDQDALTCPSCGNMITTST